MKILFHQNFQHNWQAGGMAEPNMHKHQVLYLTRRDDIEFADIKKAIFKEHRTSSDATHTYIRPVSGTVLQGQNLTYRTAVDIKQPGVLYLM